MERKLFPKPQNQLGNSSSSSSSSSTTLAPHNAILFDGRWKEEIRINSLSCGKNVMSWQHVYRKQQTVKKLEMVGAQKREENVEGDGKDQSCHLNRYLIILSLDAAAGIFDGSNKANYLQISSPSCRCCGCRSILL
jgi:hypothetical protein